MACFCLWSFDDLLKLSVAFFFILYIHHFDSYDTKSFISVSVSLMFWMSLVHRWVSLSLDLETYLLILLKIISMLLTWNSPSSMYIINRLGLFMVSLRPYTLYSLIFFEFTSLIEWPNFSCPQVLMSVFHMTHLFLLSFFICITEISIQVSFLFGFSSTFLPFCWILTSFPKFTPFSAWGSFGIHWGGYSYHP